jgi:hypothetical protein
MPSIGDMYRRNIQSQLAGTNANQYQAAAQRQALSGAQAIGAGMAGVAPALAARQAQQAAAQQSAGIAAQASQMRLGEQQAAGQMAAQQEEADRSRLERYIGLGLQTAGAAGGMLLSDEEAKHALSGGARAADQLISSLEPERYEYREGMGQPGGQRLGVMAQDVEQGGPMGAAMVGRRPDGMRGIDRDAAISAILASVGRLGERIDSIDRGGRR